MKRTALLLSTVLLSGLLVTPPAVAAPAVKVAVAKVKASSTADSGDCPTTVGFSATVSAKGKGTVRYRWVRGDGTKGSIKSFTVGGSRKVTVRDRQTFEESVKGWQAVEILGRKGLSRKAYFSVVCASPAKVYDAAHRLPAHATKPLVAAADVDVTPPAYSGACPTTVRFTGTIQVSRTPARVAYRWVDSAQGDGPVEYLDFPAGGPRLKQVVLPLSVGSTTGGWKAIRVTRGHDSGRATYQVTCTSTPTPTPTITPSSTGTPTPGPTDPPPAKPVAAIPYLTPGDYEGTCTAPIEYNAWGTIQLPAGPATTVTYRWILNGSPWQEERLDFTESGSARSSYVFGRFSLNDQQSGTHTLGLMVEGGSREPVERTFVLKCLTESPPVTVALGKIDHLVSYPDPDCDESPRVAVDVTLTLDRAGEVEYRWLVAGRTFTSKKALGAGTTKIAGGTHLAATSGIARFEVLNHNKPVKEISYTVKCLPK